MANETAETILKTWMSRVWGQSDVKAIDELLAPSALAYGLGPDPLKGPADWKKFHAGFTGAFKDIKIRVEDQVVSGEKVAARIEGSCVHRATGKSVTFAGMIIARVSGGQIQEGWNTVDFLPMLTTLGAVPEGVLAKALGAN